MNLLRANLPDLIDNLDVQDCMLYNELIKCECITLQQKIAIQSEATSYEKNALLIDILTRRSLADFKKFKMCLSLTNQPHITKYLSEGGGNEHSFQLYIASTFGVRSSSYEVLKI